MDLHGPAGSGQFGYGVFALPNGYIVVTDPNYSLGSHANVGAVYLYNGGTRALISALTGSQAGDNVGLSVTALTNGNYVVRSPYWTNGAAAKAGALTWCSGALGCTGVITTTNSVLGGVASGGSSLNFAYDYHNNQLVVGRPAGREPGHLLRALPARLSLSALGEALSTGRGRPNRWSARPGRLAPPSIAIGRIHRLPGPSGRTCGPAQNAPPDVGSGAGSAGAARPTLTDRCTDRSLACGTPNEEINAVTARKTLRILLDTNVVLDVLLEREPWLADAQSLWQAFDNEQLTAYLPASVLSDIFYVARRLTDIVRARQRSRSVWKRLRSRLWIGVFWNAPKC